MLTATPSDDEREECNAMTVLVTGGAGYIGSHTVRGLRERGRDVVVLDTLETGFEAALLGAPLVVGDIADGDLVRRVVHDHGVDGIIHFAGYKNAGESMRLPGRYFANNVVGTARLLGAIEGSSVRHFVFSGSCSVYGTPDHLPVDERAPLQPESPYGQSKLMGEQLLRWYGDLLGLRWMSLRYFNAAGASADARIGEDIGATLNLVPLVMKAALGLRPPVQVFGTDFPTADGTAVRDYIHVDDLTDGHLRALEHLEGGGRCAALNLSTGRGSSVQEVIDTTERVSGRAVPVERIGRRPGDPSAVYGDNLLAAELLGWRPARNLDDIVASAWHWHSTNPGGYAGAARARPASLD
jgi:UDP-glucose-4-epimerase GalE